MNPIEHLQNQLFDDMERFSELMNRQASGEVAIKKERDQLEGAVEIKLAILEGLKRQQEEEGIGEELLMEVDEELLLDDGFEEDEDW